MKKQLRWFDIFYAAMGILLLSALVVVIRFSPGITGDLITCAALGFGLNGVFVYFVHLRRDQTRWQVVMQRSSKNSPTN